MTGTSLALATVVMLSALGQAPDVAPAADAADATHAAQQRWRYFQELPLTDDGEAAPWRAFTLPAEVFSAARFDLADLRLIDAQGTEVPYVIRTLRPQKKDEVVPARQFNESRSEQRVWEVSLDLGETPPEHNQVEVDTAGTEFRRAATLEGSDDGQQWRTLVEKLLVRFPNDRRHGEELDNRRFVYSGSRFRYLRVRVQPDPLVDGHTDAVTVRSVTVGRTVDVPGEYIAWKTQLGLREPTRTNDRPSSTWIVELSGDHIPLEKLRLDVGDVELARDYVVEIAETRQLGYQFNVIGAGTLTRRGDRPPAPLEIDLNELWAARVRLNVLDYSNPPVELRNVQVLSAVRELVFAETPDRQGPLRLYYGNLKAAAPHYDLERTLPTSLVPAPKRSQLGGEQPNPVYEPEPLPVSERWPWLIYVILSVVSIVVGLILVDVGRRVVAMHDAQEDAKGEIHGETV